MEGVLPCKVDRTDIHELDILASKLQYYDDFTIDIHSKMSDLLKRFEAVNNVISLSNESYQQLEEKVLKLSDEFGSLVKFDKVFADIEVNANQLALALENCATNDKLSEVSIYNTSSIIH